MVYMSTSVWGHLLFNAYNIPPTPPPFFWGAESYDVDLTGLGHSSVVFNSLKKNL